jgi:hypothetical protein
VFETDWSCFLSSDGFIEILSRYGLYMVLVCLDRLRDVVPHDWPIVERRLRVLMAEKGRVDEIRFLEPGEELGHEPLWARGCRAMITPHTVPKRFSALDASSTYSPTYVDMMVYAASQYASQETDACALWLARGRDAPRAMQLLAQRPQLVARAKTAYRDTRQTQSDFAARADQMLRDVCEPLQRQAAEALDIVNGIVLARHHADGPGAEFVEKMRGFRSMVKTLRGATTNAAKATEKFRADLQWQEAALQWLCGLPTAWYYERAYALMQAGLPALAIKRILQAELPGLAALLDDVRCDAIELRARRRFMLKAAAALEPPAKRARSAE